MVYFFDHMKVDVSISRGDLLCLAPAGASTFIDGNTSYAKYWMAEWDSYFC